MRDELVFRPARHDGERLLWGAHSKLMREFAEHISPAFHSVGVDLPRDGAAMAVAALHLEAIQPAVTHPPLRVGESFGLGR
jgi:hypothetical protein